MRAGCKRVREYSVQEWRAVYQQTGTLFLQLSHWSVIWSLYDIVLCWKSACSVQCNAIVVYLTLKI